MFCPECGNEMPDKAKFCMGCGAKIEGSAEEPSKGGSVSDMTKVR